MEEINDYRNVIIGSSPRTGGMWTYNIIREIFLQLNKKIIPLDVPNNDNEMMHCHIKNLDSKEDFISIIKIHKLVKKEYTNKTKMIINPIPRLKNMFEYHILWARKCPNPTKNK